MRNYGRNVIQICEFLEASGPAGSGAIAKGVGIQSVDIGVYCQRAVRYGLVTVQKPERRSTISFSIYTVNPEWKSQLKGKVNAPKPKKPEPKYDRIASVWEIGHWKGASASK